jgi:hypothetical protein
MKTLRSALAVSAAVIAGLAPGTAAALALSTTIVTPGPFAMGQTGIEVTVVADEALAVGSTDITLNWDLDGLRVDSATSSVLSGFIANIDNGARSVRTASAAFSTDDIPAGTPLMHFLLSANAAGTYALFLTDGDGIGPDDLAGAVPPVPAPSIPYTSRGAVLRVPEPAASALVLWGLGAALLLGRRTRDRS